MNSMKMKLDFTGRSEIRVIEYQEYVESQLIGDGLKNKMVYVDLGNGGFKKRTHRVSD